MLSLAQRHVRQLDLPPGVLPFDFEKQSDQPERDRDRLRVFVGVLNREHIDDMLVDERGLTVRERVAAQLVIGLKL